MSLYINDGNMIRNTYADHAPFYMGIVGYSPTLTGTNKGPMGISNAAIPDSDWIGKSDTPKIRFLFNDNSNKTGYASRIYEYNYNDIEEKEIDNINTYATYGWGIAFPFKITRVIVIPQETANKHYNHYTTLDTDYRARYSTCYSILSYTGDSIPSKNSNGSPLISVNLKYINNGVLFFEKASDFDIDYYTRKFLFFVWGEV